jgi:DNA-binding response OmpR family regulator
MGDAKKKILVVEDDTALRAMYKGKFEADGFEVLTADNGADGLELAKNEKPDIIMLDVIMPQIDGFSVLQELKNDTKTKSIPTIMLTSLGTDEDKEKGEKMGAVDYIVKANLTPAQVSEKIKKYLK